MEELEELKGISAHINHADTAYAGKPSAKPYVTPMTAAEALAEVAAAEKTGTLDLQNEMLGYE